MKPIFTKFFGDIEKAKRLMPKARARMKLLAQAQGEFLGGVRIDRSLWDGVEITVYEYVDLYVIRIDAPGPKEKRPRQGGVWCIPIDDYYTGSYGGYDRFGEPISNRLIPGPSVGDIWNPEGSWSHMTLDPKDAIRGVTGPYDNSVSSTIDGNSQNPPSLDPNAQFHIFPAYGVGQRGNDHSWHEPSKSYLSWDMGWQDIAHIGFTLEDIQQGRIYTQSSRYFGIPSGDKLYWNGHVLGEVPSESATGPGGKRHVIGAGIVGGNTENLTVVAVLGDFTNEIYGTYLDQFNQIRKSTASVWKRSFPGNEDEGFRFGNAFEQGFFDPEAGITRENGWIKLGDVDIPTRWDLQSVVTNINLNSNAYTSWYTRYCRFRGTAMWNENPKKRLDGTNIYEFSGAIACTAGLEQENNPTPDDFPVRQPTDQGTFIGGDFQFCGNDLTASFYTITLNEDLTGFELTWEDVMEIPEDNTLLTLCSPWGIGFDPILRATPDINGWCKGAIDYRNGDKTYFEHRVFLDDAKYPEAGQHPFELNWSNRVNQLKWNNHSFTGTANYWWDDGSGATGDDPPFDYDVDHNEFIIMGLDMRRDVAWVCQYYAQKRRETIPLDPEYYNTFIGQNLSHYLVRPIDPTDPDSAAEVVFMYDEIDGHQALGTYNLNGDISTPSSPFTTLPEDLSDPYGSPCNDITAINWIDNYHPNPVGVGLNALHVGESGSNRHIRVSGDRNLTLPDGARIQASKIGFGVCHNGDVFCAKVASVYGAAGTGYNELPEWTGVNFVIRPAFPDNQRCIMWDSLNGLNSYVNTFNCPNNDQDCLWLGVIG